MQITKIIAYASNQGAFNQIFSLLSFIHIKATIYLSHGAAKCTSLTNCDFICLKNINELFVDNSLTVDPNTVYSFVGLSAYSYTHELQFLAFCKRFNIKVSCIQDYPGFYGNFTRSCIPDSFLIPDNFHHIPDQDNGISHIHIPNPYHLLLANDDKRTEHIKANISNMNPRKNALFLQPLQIPGMIYNFQEFLNVIPSDTYYDVILHPEDYHNEELLDNLPSLLGSQFRVFNSQIDSLSSLASCTRLVTCYSTVALQLEDSFFPFNINCNQVHYLFAGDDIRKSFRSSTDLDFPPLLKTIQSTIHTDTKTFPQINNAMSGRNKVSSSQYDLRRKTQILRKMMTSLFLN